MNAKANAQDQELLAIKLKAFQEEAAAKVSPGKQDTLLAWFIKYGLETVLQAVPRSSQLEVILQILKRHQGAVESLFKQEHVVCGLLEKSREIYDLAFINEQFQIVESRQRYSEEVTNKLEKQFSELMDRAQNTQAILFVQSLHLFVSMRMAFPKQTHLMLSNAGFRRQATQVSKCYEYVLKPLFERKSLKRHYGKLHGLVSWLVLLGDRTDLAYDLSKKINSFLIYNKSQNSIQMINVCNTLFDLLSTRLPKESTLKHQNLAALLVRLDSSSVRMTQFLEIWIQTRGNFMDTIDFTHFIRTVGSLGASRLVLEILMKLWNIMLDMRKYGILLHVFSGFIRKEFTGLSVLTTQDFILYLKIVKHFMIGLSNRERFEGQQVDQLTANICRHALRRGISMSSCYRHIVDIYSTYQNRFSCLSENSKRFFNQVQALAKFRMQTAEIHAVYQQYAIRELGVDDNEGEWQSLRKRSNRYRGLQNLGNTCYINAFLQALYMTKKFRMLVHAFTQDGALPSSKAKLYAVQFVFQQLTRKEFQYLQPHKPDYFRSELPQPFRSSFTQQDSAEFGRIYLQELSKELQGGYVQKLQRLLVQKLVKLIRCQECATSKKQEESVFDLILTLEKGDPSILLSKLIINYFKAESFTGQDRLDCGQCKRRTDAISQLIPQKFSQVLVLTLSIFEYVGQGKKILLPLTFEFTLNLSALLNNPELGQYELYAFIVHIGSVPSSGHYVCYARNLEQNPMVWYNLNDGYVEELEIAKPEDFGFSQNQSPYMLYYSKKPVTASKIGKS